MSSRRSSAALAEKVSRRLKKAGLAGRVVTLKLKTADFRLRTRSRQLADPTQLADRIFSAGAELLAPGDRRHEIPPDRHRRFRFHRPALRRSRRPGRPGRRQARGGRGGDRRDPRQIRQPRRRTRPGLRRGEKPRGGKPAFPGQAAYVQRTCPPRRSFPRRRVIQAGLAIPAELLGLYAGQRQKRDAVCRLNRRSCPPRAGASGRSSYRASRTNTTS